MDVRFENGNLKYLDDCEVAKHFYKKIGYKQVGVIPSLYRKGITEYVMMNKEI